jgi:hypothetical protein
MDVQYVVDTSAELAEITPLECAALYLIDPAYRQVDKLMADDRLLPDDFLQNTARQAISLAAPELRHWVALNSLRSVTTLSRCIKERAQYLLQKKIQSDLEKTAPFPMIEGLAENGNDFWAEKMVTTESEVTETVVRAILTRHMGGFLQRLKEDNECVDAAVAWYHKDGGKMFRHLQLSHRATLHDRESLSGTAFAKAVAEQKKRMQIQNKRPVRGAIKKVCKLFAQFRQEDNLRLFVSGQEVQMSHPDSPLKFVLRPLGEPGWLEERSAKGRAHTPYDLSVLTKDDLFIAKLCVYFNDTPVLDQLLALSLFVQAGDELKVLEKANFFAFEDGQRDKAKDALISAYPSLESKFPRAREVPNGFDYAEVIVPGQRYPIIDLGAPFRAEQDHWEPFKGRVEAWVETWFEPVFSQLLPKAHLMQIAG